MRTTKVISISEWLKNKMSLHDISVIHGKFVYSNFIEKQWGFDKWRPRGTYLGILPSVMWGSEWEHPPSAHMLESWSQVVVLFGRIKEMQLFLEEVWEWRWAFTANIAPPFPLRPFSSSCSWFKRRVSCLCLALPVACCHTSTLPSLTLFSQQP